MKTDGQRDGKRVENVLLFRAVNEKLRALNLEFEGFANESAVFVCECNQLDCMEQIELAVATFDDVREQPFRFIVVPGHEGSDGADRVVDRSGTYLVVEKLAPLQ